MESLIDIRDLSDIEKISILSLYTIKNLYFDDHYQITEDDLIEFFMKILPKVKFIATGTFFKINGIERRTSYFTSSSNNNTKVEHSILLDEIAKSINNHLDHHFVFSSIRESGFNLVTICGEFIKDDEAIRDMKIDTIIE